MELLINNSYILVVEGTDRKLTYTCKIIYIDNDSVKFIDKFGKILSYRKDKIISAEEVENER